MIREGQIYKRPNGVIICITQSEPKKEELIVREQKEIISGMYCYVTSKGFTGTIADCVIVGLKLIAQYPTWREAVISKEFMA